MMAFGTLGELIAAGTEISQLLRFSRNLDSHKALEKLLRDQETIIHLLQNKGEIDNMKILKHLIEKADDTLEEIEWYAEKAHHLRADHKALADTYAKVAEMHLSIYTMLHERMVSLIEDQHKTGTPVPAAMMAIWDYEHEKLVKEFAEAKYMVDEYKKLGY